ncbi:hypothetical protein H072_2756 [Dactylellina haptotyla CBS 200.50]|uniref:Uncharacterized protein n=1 Tax=Dactylellina haptotyla (strain CBS 200.50) TaxID=1284197 RepID=S8AQ77_DACHA|nr:hypothetical protein H072_2756 [Dactylellina haptotyla CBS 200.50]
MHTNNQDIVFRKCNEDDTSSKSSRCVSPGPAEPTNMTKILFENNPATFCRDAMKTSIEVWNFLEGRWIQPSDIQCPHLKFTAREGKVLLFVTSHMAEDIRGEREKQENVLSYILVWDSKDIVVWSYDATDTARGVELAVAYKFLGLPQLLTVGAGNKKPIIVDPENITWKWRILKAILYNIKDEFAISGEHRAAVWLRFRNAKPINPRCMFLRNKNIIPGKINCSTERVAIETPYYRNSGPPTAWLGIDENRLPKVRPLGQGPVVPVAIPITRAVTALKSSEPSKAREQSVPVLLEFLDHNTPPSPPSTTQTSPCQNAADLLGLDFCATISPISSPANLSPSLPLDSDEDFTQNSLTLHAHESAVLNVINGKVRDAAGNNKDDYVKAVREKMEQLEKMLEECKKEVEKFEGR